MSEKRPADWESIERDYRAGILSLREIAGPFKITETAIRKRAKRDGWERDLEAKIHAKADALVRKAEVRKQVRNDQIANERETIEAVAEAIVSVRLRHRSDISRTMHVAGELIAVLEGIAFDETNVREFSGVLRQLADTQKTLIGMEREAYGLDKSKEEPPPPAEFDPMEGARRIAFALSRASQHTIQ